MIRNRMKINIVAVEFQNSTINFFIIKPHLCPGEVSQTTSCLDTFLKLIA